MSRLESPEGLIDDPHAFAVWLYEEVGYKRWFPRERQIEVFEAVVTHLLACRGGAAGAAHRPASVPASALRSES